MPRLFVSRALALLLVSTGGLFVSACGRTAAIVDGSADAGTLPNASVEALEITPAHVVLARGTTLQLTATTRWSDGSRRDESAFATWSSSNPLLVSVDMGNVRAIAAGDATITVKTQGLTATATVVVSMAAVSSLTVEPATSIVPVGTTLQLHALGILDDGTKQELTGDATWKASDTTKVDVSGGGLVTALAAGKVTVSATFEGISASASIEVTISRLAVLAVTPTSATLTVGERATFTATATYDDNTVADVTKQAAWTSTDPAVVDVDADGVALALSAGAVTIQATFGGSLSTAQATVSDVALTAIEVTPAVVTIAPGEVKTFTAKGIFADGRSADLTASAVWSADPAIATVSNSPGHEGEVSAIAVGKTDVVATFRGVAGKAKLTVGSGVVTSIKLAPLTPSIAVGRTLALTATAVADDGTTRDVTGAVVWTVSNAAVASVSNVARTAGQITAIAVGSVTITATLGAITASTTATVTPAVLESFVITPDVVTVPAGTLQAFFARGSYSDGRTLDVTEKAVWSLENTRIAAVSNQPGAHGQVTTKSSGHTILHAVADGRDVTADLTITPPTIIDLQVTPFVGSIAIGQNQQMQATVVWSDGRTENVTGTATWSTSDANVATITTGGRGGGGPGGGGPGGGGQNQRQANGLSVGNVTITVTYQGKTGTARLTVTDAVLVSISVNPVLVELRVNGTQPLQATGIYSDGSTRNLNNVSWSSSAPSVANVSNAGGGGGPGGGGPGGGGRGQVTALSVGVATITATVDGFRGTAQVTVTAAVAIALQINPVVASIANGDTQSFQATAIFDDNTSQNVTNDAAWTSSAGSVAEVSNGGGGGPGGGGPGGGGPGGGRGTATSFGAGTTTITAIWKGLQARATLTVTDAVLRSIDVTPATVSLAAGLSQPFQATGLYSDGTSRGLTQQATWQSSAPAIVAISNGQGRGNATTLQPGTVTISATADGVTGTATLIVTSAVLTEIQVTPVRSTVGKGATQTYTATALYSDFTTRNVTNDATWTASDATVAQVSNGNGSRGRATTLKEGTTNISASWQGRSGTAQLTVTSATIREIQVTPSTLSLPIGLTQRLSATAVLTDNSTRDVTNESTWTISNAAIATVSNAGQSRGTASTWSAGTVTISATYAGITGTSTLVVGTQTLQAIAVTPTGGTVRAGATIQFTAVGTWDDGSTRDLTGTATWIATSSAISTVSNAADSRGLATGLAAGNTLIEAHFQGRTGSSTLSVTP